MMKPSTLTKLSITLLCLCASTQTFAAERWALVIANQNYKQAGATLREPIQNAQAVKQALVNKGFRLLDNRVHQDLNKEQFERVIKRFSQQAQGAEAALVYYAGHGVQDQQSNYLIPVNADIADEIDLRNDGVRLKYLLGKLGLSNAATNLVFLDACRDNPFGKSTMSLSRGLKRIEPSTDMQTIISYSTSEGKTAADNSTYTPALVKHIQSSDGLQVELLLKRVAAAVRQGSGGQQVPMYTTSLVNDFCFGECGGGSSPKPADYIEPEMVAIKGGTFTMGSPSSEAGRNNDEKPHNVTVGNFQLGKTEVTVGEFKRFVQATNYRTDAERTGEGCRVFDWDAGKYGYQKAINWRRAGFSQTDQHPVVCVSSNDAFAYANWLSQRTGKRYELPTEAQWEYAARAGTQGARYWGSNPDQACAYENVYDQRLDSQYPKYKEHKCNDNAMYTSPVGRYQGNRFGLKDMLGNVSEWTCSAYEENYNGSEQRCAPKNDARSRVLRGGSWSDSPEGVRSADRFRSTAAFRFDVVGFRLSRKP